MSETEIPRSDETKAAWKSLRDAFEEDMTSPNRVAFLLEALIDEKIADAIEAMADRVEAATGNRP